MLLVLLNTGYQSSLVSLPVEYVGVTLRKEILRHTETGHVLCDSLDLRPIHFHMFGQRTEIQEISSAAE